MQNIILNVENEQEFLKKNKGLTQSQVNKKINEGESNQKIEFKGKTIKLIIKNNVFTIFNILNFLFAILVFSTGQYKNMLFISIVVSNIVIGIYQEIKSKIIIDKLSLVTKSTFLALRDGKLKKISNDDIVKDDVLILKSGDQIPADAKICFGCCEVNESMITGESLSISKKQNDLLLSGSFLVSGKVYVQIIKVGKDTYVNKITQKLKAEKIANSQILTTITSIIKIMCFIIIPLGIGLALKQYFVLQMNIDQTIIKTVSILIGMIPEGLVLLSTVVMAVGVIKLSKNNVLVQELYSIESLARVNMLCLDKTGTITSGNMKVCEIINVDDSNKEFEAKEILNELTNASKDDLNATSLAIKEYCCDIKPCYKIKRIIPFSSERKFSGAEFEGKGTYLIGAINFLLKDDKISPNINKKIKEQLLEGKRVIALIHTSKGVNQKYELPDDLKLIFLIVLQDEIRQDAKKTFSYFYKQGVDIKIISGDDPLSVSKIALNVGVKNAENYIDVSKLSNIELRNAVKENTIFGRVSPFQKLEIIKYLKEMNNTVAMVGDGVNDTLALKESDCSIAMAKGSDSAKNISEIVLLDSSFSNMPKIFNEGRRSINNLERSFSIFIVKTIYSTILGFFFLIFNYSYPIQPIQTSMISFFAIGVPSFVLALEPDYKIVKGGFLPNILKFSLPGAVSIIINMIITVVILPHFGFNEISISTIAYNIISISSILVIIHLSKPFNILRICLLGFILLSYLASVTIISSFISIEHVNIPYLLTYFIIIISVLAMRFVGSLILKFFNMHKIK